MNKPLLQIIIGSTRPGRVGLPVAHWVEKVASEHGAFEVEVVDLAVVDLPLIDEPNHPMLRQYTKDHTKAWSAIIDRGDAYVFVMPEYNHGVNSALKNAIDFLWNEWANKPVSTVSYGGVAGGTRAVQQLKQTMAALRLYAVVAAVQIPFVFPHVTGEGDERIFTPTAEVASAAPTMLDALAAFIPASTLLRTGAS